MLLSYIKLSLRLLSRSPFITAINIVGLSIGFAAFYILWPYAHAELTTDRFHKDYERIARLTWHHRWTDNKLDWQESDNAVNFCGVAKHIADEFKEVEELTRLVGQGGFQKALQGTGDKVFMAVYERDSTKHFFREEKVAFADPNFFQFFSFPLEKGDPALVLMQPGTVVLSQEVSRKYFGASDPVNSIIYLNDSLPLKVTGVFEALPRNTYFHFDMVISTAGLDEIDDRFPSTFDNPTWMGENFIRIREGVSFANLQQQIDARRKIFYNNIENADPTVNVEPLKDIAFSDSSLGQVYKPRPALIVLAALSFVILFLAGTNYVSLSISTLHKRMPEVGTRKVVGAGRKDFAVQFFVESAIINLFALALSLTLIQLVKYPAEYLFHFYVVEWKTIIDEHFAIFLIVPLTTIVLTGLYPVVISSRKDAVVLLKRLRGSETPWWIKSLITFQYASAIVLLIWVVAVYFQLDYILSKNLGINKSGVITVNCPLNRTEDFNSKLEYFVNEAYKVNGVRIASLSKSIMGDGGGLPQFAQRKEGAAIVGLFSNGGVDENFLGLYGIRLLEGRNFSSNGPSNQKTVLLSNEAIKRLGFSSPSEAIGARIILNYTVKDVEIIGVYDEYEYLPFFAHLQKSPGTLLTYKNTIEQDQPASKISFRIDLQETASIVARLAELYKSVFPIEAFTWVFLDQNIRRNYAQEQITRNQIILFTFLAIGIACLGLLGTTSNKVVEKTKEIGIRKILGAPLHQIALLIINTSLKQLLISIVIGVPLAYLLVEKYQERYSERMEFSWWHYALPVAMLIVIMILTIAGTLVKASRTNPVESLRSE
ncbi:MAG TPA: ABC transporter permease [Chryseolinea sp.]